jgi:hypothetical protein
MAGSRWNSYFGFTIVAINFVSSLKYLELRIFDVCQFLYYYFAILVGTVTILMLTLQIFIVCELSLLGFGIRQVHIEKERQDASEPHDSAYIGRA